MWRWSSVTNLFGTTKKAEASQKIEIDLDKPLEEEEYVDKFDDADESKPLLSKKSSEEKLSPHPIISSAVSTDPLQEISSLVVESIPTREINTIGDAPTHAPPILSEPEAKSPVDKSEALFTEELHPLLSPDENEEEGTEVHSPKLPGTPINSPTSDPSASSSFTVAKIQKIMSDTDKYKQQNTYPPNIVKNRNLSSNSTIETRSHSSTENASFWGEVSSCLESLFSCCATPKNDHKKNDDDALNAKNNVKMSNRLTL